MSMSMLIYIMCVQLPVHARRVFGPLRLESQAVVNHPVSPEIQTQP